MRRQASAASEGPIKGAETRSDRCLGLGKQENRPAWDGITRGGRDLMGSVRVCIGYGDHLCRCNADAEGSC